MYKENFALFILYTYSMTKRTKLYSSYSFDMYVDIVVTYFPISII